MELVIGTILALSIGLLATFIGLDRDRAFYPTVMIAIDKSLERTRGDKVPKSNDLARGAQLGR